MFYLLQCSDIIDVNRCLSCKCEVSLCNLCLGCVFEVLVNQDQWRSWEGRVVQPPRTAECKGRQNERQKEYFRFLYVIFCAHQILNFLSQMKENPVKDVISFKFLISARSG